MANTFSEVEYHLTIPKTLFDKMMKEPKEYDSSEIIHKEVRVT